MSDIHIEGKICSPKGTAIQVNETLLFQEGGSYQRVLPLTRSGEAVAVLSPRQEGGVLEVVKCNVFCDGDEIDGIQGRIELQEGQIAQVTSNLSETGEEPLSFILGVEPSMRESSR